MKKVIAVLMTFIVSGCASPRETATALARDSGWQWSIVSAGKFDLASAEPEGQHAQTLWVYLEGDGVAYLSPTRPSSDPTPDDPVALRLALAQPPGSAIAYLARPCQYTLPGHNRGCTQGYWTSARYAPEVIDSTNLAIDAMKANAGASHVVLVGYSGGGAVAVLTATRRKDVAGIITVAANLDLAYWARRNGLTPLADSLDPANFAGAVATIPQIHFTGAQDKVVATDVVQAFVDKLPARAPVRIVEVPGFTHTCCWVETWNGLVIRPEVKPALGQQY